MSKYLYPTYSPMSKNTLDKLFGSHLRVKILKNTLRNYPADFSLSELAKRVQESPGVVKKELTILVRLGLVRHK